MKLPATKWFVPLILTVATLLSYSNALNNPFLMDDHAFFSDPKIANPKFFFYNFIPDQTKYLKIDNAAEGATYYRPLAHAVPMLEWLVFKGNRVLYHVLSLIFFIGLCLMIRRIVIWAGGSAELGLLTALVFCVHPINGLMVNYKTAIVFPIQLMLMLGALFSLNNIFLSCLFFILALMCHETALMLPLYATLAYLWLQPQGKRDWKKLIPLWGVAVGYFVWRLQYASLKTSILDQYPEFKVSIFEYLASLTKLWGWYISKLFYPEGVVMIWATPPQRDGVWLYLGILLLAMLGIWRILVYYKSRDRMSFYALIWFLIGFIPTAFACLFKPKQGFMMEPHWMFFSSIGFFMWLSRLVLAAGKKHVPAIALTLVLLLMITSRFSNALWASEITYCRYWLEQAPGFKAVMFYLAGAYNNAGRLPEARHYFEQSGRDYGILNNLALIDMALGRDKLAEEEFLASIEEEPKFSPAYNNLATLQLNQGRLKEAEANLLKAIELNRFMPQPRYLLYKIYVTQGRYTEAVQLCLDNLSVMPYDNKSLYYLVLVHLAMNDKIGAGRYAHRLLSTTRDVPLLVNLAQVCADFGMRPIVERTVAKIRLIAPQMNISIK